MNFLLNLTVEWNDDLMTVEVPVSWDSNERGEGWVMDYTSGDRALDDKIESIAFAKADRLARTASEP